MAARGRYSKGVAKRAEILDAALTIVERSGYSAATVKELADAVGLSQNGLLHYFGSKAALFTEIVRHSGELGLAEVAARGDDHGSLASHMIAMTAQTLERDGFAELHHRLAAEASEPGHPSHEYYRERQAMQVRLVAESILAMASTGELRADADPEGLAVMLWALIEGLTARRLFDPTLDVPGLVGSFFDLISASPRPDAAGGPRSPRP